MGIELNPCGTMVIETKRLILKPFANDDAESMMRNWVADDYVQDMYGEPAIKHRKKYENSWINTPADTKTGIIIVGQLWKKNPENASVRLRISWLSLIHI